MWKRFRVFDFAISKSVFECSMGWLKKALIAADGVKDDQAEARAHAIFAAVAGAQLIARGRAYIALYDTLIDSHRSARLILGSYTRTRSPAGKLLLQQNG
jgi:hypothetical protein